MTRGTVLRLLVVVPLLAAGLALGGARQASAATVCGDTPNMAETLTGVIKDSIVVKANAICGLNNNSNAQLDSNSIGANLTCAGNGVVLIFGASTVGGTENCPAT